MRMNSAFIPFLREFASRKEGIDDGWLNQILADGFTWIDDCVFLTSLVSASTNVSLKDFPDKTGYECFINHIHIDEYVKESTVRYAGLLVEKTFKSWNAENSEKVLNSIIGIDGEFVSVRFHNKRVNEPWLPLELDGFMDGVLEISSLDASFFSI